MRRENILAVPAIHFYRFLEIPVFASTPGEDGTPRSPIYRMMQRTSISRALGLAFLFFVAREAEGQTLRGSPESVDRIHRQALTHGLDFYPSAAAIRQAHERGTLVRLEPNADFQLADVSYPYVLPEARTFVLRLAGQYRAACGEKLVVTSATRPTSMRLANSVDKSVHPTGMAIDLRKPTNSRCLTWLRNTLLSLEATGVLEAVEERNPPHFHVAVFPRQYFQYVSGRAPQPRVSGTALMTRAPTPTPNPTRTYRVREGDSLWTIARRNNVSIEEIQRANNLRSTRILAGQTLVIPSAR
jgi:nucleoid-associated protein YgaU